MYPVYDDDAALLLSFTLAAKRRPAALDEIITALAMAQHGEIPIKGVSVAYQITIRCCPFKF